MQHSSEARQETTSFDWRSPDLGPAREVELPAGVVRYYERGRGQTVVFAHGWLANANLWRKVVVPLSRRFRCVVPDLPLGSHLLPMNETFDGTPETIALILNGLLDALGIDDVTLVGNDSGGAYSQIATAASPARVRRLILNACETPYDSFPPAAFDGLQQAARSPIALAELLGALRDRNLRLSPAAFGGLVKHSLDDAVSDSYALPVLELPGVRNDACKVMTTASQASVAAAGANLIAEFRGRVSFLWPTEDTFFSLDNVRRYAGELACASVELIEDSFAFTPEDQPLRMAEMIAEVMDA